MKMILCLIAFALAATQQVQAGAENIAKQRAKEVVNQSNVRQGVGAPGAPTTPPTTAQPGRPLLPDPVAKLKADIAAITGNSAVPAELKKQFITDLMACARGSRKPTPATVEKFASSLSAALTGKGIEPSVQTRLVQDINLVLNSASLSAQRTAEVGDDVQAILQTAGLARGAAVNVAGELKAIAAELQAK